MTHRVIYTRDDGTTGYKWFHGQEAAKDARRSVEELRGSSSIHRILLHRRRDGEWEEINP